MKLIIKLIITAVVAMLLGHFLEGIHFDAFVTALAFAIFLSFLNVTVKPILKIIGLPFNLMTLGLFSLVINAVVVLIAEHFINGMQIDGFWWALIFSICLSVITSIIQGIVSDD